MLYKAVVGPVMSKKNRLVFSLTCVCNLYFTEEKKERERNRGVMKRKREKDRDAADGWCLSKS